MCASFVNAFRTRLSAKLNISFNNVAVLTVTTRLNRRLDGRVLVNDVEPVRFDSPDDVGDGFDFTALDEESPVGVRDLSTLNFGPDVPLPTGTVLYIQIDIRVTNSQMTSGLINSKGLDATDVTGGVDRDTLFLLDPYMKLDRVVLYSRSGRTYARHCVCVRVCVCVCGR